MQCSKSAPLENSNQINMDESVMGFQMVQEADVQSEVVEARGHPTVNPQNYDEQKDLDSFPNVD
mgnify:CR=1 FL=1